MRPCGGAGADPADAFAEVYRRHREAVYAYLYSRCRDHDLSEDLTSETFVRALRGFDRYVARDRPIRAWLYTIARNLLTDEMKSARSKRRAPLPESADEISFVSRDPGPAELLCAKHVRELVRASVARLGKEQARCIALRFLEECSVAETSVAMRRSAGAVRALQNRGIHRLRELVTTCALAP
ncbi:sigma-70 family RNA polymerase sigma factor [Amycolatopsis sp. K13G38]|uniref:Sigma-70 family RNA polymerase sigma factor n=1 Tax=Amycolatopsis acididurans TaxID=2724524 RepID=A0ABX1IWU5_9PSEU|nr:sigma-70 family RNA polymerase sigma factor [Amycolatopsis acididurans]NKQ51960.1 sigma-70 family RNA polymerase sigma factor [Amycolatopsis acididurans]